MSKLRIYQGDLEIFEREIKDKPYLLREGRTLQLIKGKETQTSEETTRHHVELNRSEYKFLGVANMS